MGEGAGRCTWHGSPVWQFDRREEGGGLLAGLASSKRPPLQWRLYEAITHRCLLRRVIMVLVADNGREQGYKTCFRDQVTPCIGHRSISVDISPQWRRRRRPWSQYHIAPTHQLDPVVAPYARRRSVLRAQGQPSHHSHPTG